MALYAINWVSLYLRRGSDKYICLTILFDKFLGIPS
jgi:hypothetical protein